MQRLSPVSVALPASYMRTRNSFYTTLAAPRGPCRALATYEDERMSGPVQVLARSLREVDSVFPDPHFQPSVETIGGLPYLEAVILETLRLRPPAYIVGRCASRDVQLTTGRRIAGGSGVNRVDIPAGAWTCPAGYTA